MHQVTIYHNPRCSKSRQTLKLLEDRGCEITVVEYLREPPTVETLVALAQSLPGPLPEMVRPKEWADMGLAEPSEAADVAEVVAEHPELLQRPIVVRGDVARIGRPPEAVLEILE